MQYAEHASTFMFLLPWGSEAISFQHSGSRSSVVVHGQSSSDRPLKGAWG